MYIIFMLVFNKMTFCWATFVNIADQSTKIANESQVADIA